MANVNDVKRVPVIESGINLSERGGMVTFSCVNGERVSVALDSLSPELVRHAALHGIKQKCIDAAAISRNPDTGRSATPDDKWSALLEVATRLNTGGAWNKNREAGSGGGGGVLFRALCRMYPDKTPETLREFLAGKSPAEQAALRKNPKVAAIIEEIRAADADESVDTDSMLEELK